MFNRLPWFLAAALLVLCGILGWAYNNERLASQAARRAEERERLLKEKFIVALDATKRELNDQLATMTVSNATLKAEIEKIKKVVDVQITKLDSFQTEEIEIRDVAPAERCPPGRRSPRSVPRQLRAPLTPAPEQERTGAALPRLALAASGSSRPDPTGTTRGTPELVVDGEPRVPEEAALEKGVEAREASAPAAPEPSCVLAKGDRVKIIIDQVTLTTGEGNDVIAGTAALSRRTPPPEKILFQAPFDTTASSSRRRTTPPPAEKRGWGVGAYASAWEADGRTVGPVIAAPPYGLFGRTLEASVMVGVWPDFQAAAVAVARF
jgi:hypothetical protein